MLISILHISDLHRDLQDELENEALLESFRMEIGRYSEENPVIRKPDLCIVSGDLVYGVPESHADFEAETRRQYEQAKEFLIALTNEFFGGNRSKVVIIPGNHDVSFPKCFASFEKVDVPADVALRNGLVREMWNSKSKLRWSWRDFSFYRVKDSAIYQSRLMYFAEVYEAFYGRPYSLDPESQYEIFDYPDLNLTVAAISSCYQNDALLRYGGIHPKALSRICSGLRDAKHNGRIKVATWHHNIKGLPGRDDYMDSGFLQHLIDSEVVVGLHGHQHSPDCFDEQYALGPNPRKMTVISASTLCASPYHLKPGVPRGYNVIEIDVVDLVGRVHQRRMANDMFDAPIWGQGQFQLNNQPYVEFELSAPSSVAPSPIDAHIEVAIAAIAEKRWKDALLGLLPIKHEPVARPFLLKAAGELQEDTLTLDALWPPKTAGEIVAVAGAILELGDKEKAQALMDLRDVKESTDGSVSAILNELRKRLYT